METNIKLSKETLLSLGIIEGKIKVGTAVLVVIVNTKKNKVDLKYIGVVTDLVKNHDNSIFLKCLESEDNTQGLFADVYFGKNSIDFGSIVSFNENELGYVLPLTFDFVNSEIFKPFELDITYMNKMINRFMPILSKDVVWEN